MFKVTFLTLMCLNIFLNDFMVVVDTHRLKRNINIFKENHNYNTKVKENIELIKNVKDLYIVVH